MPKTKVAPLPPLVFPTVAINFSTPQKAPNKLVLRGGSLRRAAFPGMMSELDKFTGLSQIEAVAGSAAGSINALLLSLGFTAKEMEKIAAEFDIRKFLDVSTQDNIEDRGICDGKLLHAALQKLVKEKIKKHIVNLKVMLTNASPRHVNEDEILEKLNKINDEKITFSDLNFLKEVYQSVAGSSPIKKLFIAATNITDRRLATFSVDNNAEMEVATAVLISTSYPVIFKAVTYAGKQYVAGGAIDDLPQQALLDYGNDEVFAFLGDPASRAQSLAYLINSEDDSIPVPADILLPVKNYLKALDFKINQVSRFSEMYQALEDDYLKDTIILPATYLYTAAKKLTDKQRKTAEKISYSVISSHSDDITFRSVRTPEEDFTSVLLKLKINHANHHIHQIADLLRTVNLRSDSRIVPAAVAISDWVDDLNKEKKQQAQNLIAAVKRLVLLLDNYKDKKNVDEAKLNKACQRVAKLYDEYLKFKEYSSGQLSTSKRHSEILSERLFSRQPLFNQFLAGLEYYNSQQNRAFRAFDAEQSAGEGLAESLAYFQLSRKKAEIIKVLMESKNKFLQRSANQKLLSQVISAVRSAKSMDDIIFSVNKIRKHYKPRTFFAISSPSSFQTVAALDKLVEKELSHHNKKQLPSNPRIIAERTYLQPMRELLIKHAHHLQTKLLADFKRLPGKSADLLAHIKTLEYALKHSKTDNAYSQISAEINYLYLISGSGNADLRQTIMRHKVQLDTVNAMLLTIMIGNDVVPSLADKKNSIKHQIELMNSSGMRDLLADTQTNSKATSFQRLNALDNYFGRPEVQQTIAQVSGGVFSGLSINAKKDVFTKKMTHLLKQYQQYRDKVMQPADDFDLLLANRNRFRVHGDEKENIVQGTSVPVIGVTPYNRGDSVQYAKGLLFGDKASRNPTAKVAPIGKKEPEHYVGVNKGELVNEELAEEKNDNAEKLNILFAGDLMVSDSGVPPVMTEDYLEEIKNADAFVINIEAPVSFKEGKQARGGLGFEMSKSYLADFVKQIKDANPTIKIVYNIANNHALDGNDKAPKPNTEKEKRLYESDPKNYILLRTIAAINEIDKDGMVIGAHAMKDKSLVQNDPIGVLDIKGVRVGLLGFTDVMNWNSKYWNRRVYRSEDIPENLNKVKQDMNLDYICPFGHGSLEQSIYTTQHWRDLLVKLANRGASMVIGHGPHVPQTNEVLNGKLLVHSLGNLFGPKKLAGTGLNIMAKVEFSKAKVNFEMLLVEATVDKKGVPVIKRISHPKQTAYPHLLDRLKHLFPTANYPDPQLEARHAVASQR